MKKTIFLITMILFISIKVSIGQPHISQCIDCGTPFQQLETKDGVTYLAGSPISDVVKDAELLFEGRVLPDSLVVNYSPGITFTYRHVLVLKQFKGKFKSDTITISHYPGRNGDVKSNMQSGVEAIFFVSSVFAPKRKIHIPEVYWMVYNENSSLVKVCEIKDVMKELYEPIEQVTGQKYVDVHSNNCKGK